MSGFGTAAKALGMSPLGLGLTIGGAVLGFFGSRRKRKKARRQRAQARELLGQQYGALRQARRAEAAEFAQQREFLGEGQQLAQQAAIQQYGLQQQGLQSQVGMTGLAGSGAGMQMMQQGQMQFAQQQAARDLGVRESSFQLGMREAASIRDIQSTGFELDRYAAEKGIKSSYGQSLLDIYGGV
tara:strand:- start:3825 stop:4376 length:552 start_codon:yes stop_codon:yes gene_type:complete